MRGELSQEVIVKAALELVDEHGLPALSMRRLGTALGVQGMAIYHHFPSKDAVLDALVSSIFPVPPQPTGQWRTDLRELSRLYRDSVTAHPALIPYLMAHPMHTDRAAASREAQYAALRLAGLDGSVLLDAHRTWGSYVLGYVIVEQQGKASDFTDRDWRPPLRTEFPISADIDAYQAARSWDEQFDIGLEMIFDGIAALPRR
jgi:AcrR family transcriptional regulator